MATQHLFQLGMDLETGTTQKEEFSVQDKGACKSTNVIPLERQLLNTDRDDHFIRREGKVYAGTHLILEVLGGHNLDCIETVEAALRRCVYACKATLLHIHLHKFAPQGVSGVAVLAESHISVHTWPEAGYGAFDVFMCGDAEPWNAIEILREAFNADDVLTKELLRGEGIV